MRELWLVGGVVRIECRHLPREQVLDAVDGMLGDAREHLAQVLFWVQVVEFRGADQTVEGGGALSAPIGTCEEIILAPQRDGSQRPFGGGMPTSGLCRAISPPMHSERESAALIVAEAA